MKRGSENNTATKRRKPLWLFVTIAALIGISLAAVKLFWKPAATSTSSVAVPHSDLRAEGYVDPQACAECHADVVETYQHTGMARTFHRPSKETLIEDFSRANRFVHKASGLTYTMLERDGKWFQRRSAPGFGGKESDVLEEQIDYVIGSGNHGRAYLHRTAQGKLVQLPISWYVENGGYWNMSPGLDRPDQPDMHGTVAADCIFCHTAYPLATDKKSPDDEQVFPETLPEGIDCQRCHGPGAKHIAAARSKASDDDIRKLIVNPGHLSRERQLEVCMECHLETSAHHIPNSIRNYAKDINRFRPGEPIGAYKIYFERPNPNPAEFEMAHASYQLPRSACFQKSQMTCLTCHDPHNVPHGEPAKQQYIETCQRCHAATKDIGHDPGHKGVQIKTGSDCLSCHMPKRRPEGSVHLVLTDHWIRRRIPPGNLTAPMLEKAPKQDRTKVQIYYPVKDKPADADLYLAIAQVNDAGVDGTGNLEAELQRVKPNWPDPYVALGRAYLDNGKFNEALRTFQQALDRRADDHDALDGMSTALVQANRTDEAIAMLRRGADRYPNDDRFLANLGGAYLQQNKLQEADDVLWKALVVNPENSHARDLLGLSAVQRGDKVHAEENFREAIRLQPLAPEPHNNLANLLTGQHNLNEAEFQFRRALQLNPAYADAHHGLGLLMILASRNKEAGDELTKATELSPRNVQMLVDLGDLRATEGRTQDAVDAYSRALQLNPAQPDANLSLATLLLQQGQSDAAIPHLMQAAQGPDPDVAQHAQGMLATLRR